MLSALTSSLSCLVRMHGHHIYSTGYFFSPFSTVYFNKKNIARSKLKPTKTKIIKSIYQVACAGDLHAWVSQLSRNFLGRYSSLSQL
jgi:hypothetical protein